jgi:Mg/Co/Ni transporter MgtE
MKNKTAEEILRHHLHSHVTKDNLKRFYSLVSYEREIEAMEIYAAQEREKAVNEFKQRLIKEITSEVNFDDGYDSILSVQNIIEKLK